jgi:hypothetical protein
MFIDMLIAMQALDDVVNDRFPLAPEEAAFLSALRAQAELNDFNETNLKGVCAMHGLKPIDLYFPEGLYTRIIDEYVPKHLHPMVTAEKIAAEHKKLKGRSVKEVNTAYLKYIQAWKLYGATIFEVLVCTL